jgi:hypothetical protein
MNYARWVSQSVRILGGQNVHFLDARFDDADYSLETAESMLTGCTGLLSLFTLRALRAGLPSFAGRWDDAADTVDVDLIGPREEKEAFKAGDSGYRGHHSVVISRHPRQYKIEIATPHGLAFIGCLSLNLDIATKSSPIETTLGISFDAELIKGHVSPEQ